MIIIIFLFVFFTKEDEDSTSICVCNNRTSSYDLCDKCPKNLEKIYFEKNSANDNFIDYIRGIQQNNQTTKNFDISVAFSEQPLEFDLSLFDFSFVYFHPIHEISEKYTFSLNIFVDIETSTARLVLSNAELSFLSKIVQFDKLFFNYSEKNGNLNSINENINHELYLDYLEAKNNTQIYFHKIIPVLHCKCALFDNIEEQILKFNDIYIESGFCSIDLIIEIKSKFSTDYIFVNESLLTLYNKNDFQLKTNIHGTKNAIITNVNANGDLIRSNQIVIKGGFAKVSPEFLFVVKNIKIALKAFDQIIFQNSFNDFVEFNVTSANTIVINESTSTNSLNFLSFSNTKLEIITNLPINGELNLNGEIENVSISLFQIKTGNFIDHREFFQGGNPNDKSPKSDVKHNIEIKPKKSKGNINYFFNDKFNINNNSNNNNNNNNIHYEPKNDDNKDENSRFKIIVKTSKNFVELKSSYIDLYILNCISYYDNFASFCVGKGGASKVTIVNFLSKDEVNFSFPKFNRDFSNYIEDSEIEKFINSNVIYLEFQNETVGTGADDNVSIVFVTDQQQKDTYVHGFSEHDSILEPHIVSRKPLIYAVFFNSPNKQPLKLCYTNDEYKEYVSASSHYSFIKISDNFECLKLEITDFPILSTKYIFPKMEFVEILIDPKISIQKEGFSFIFKDFYVENLKIFGPNNQINEPNIAFLAFQGNVTNNLSLSDMIFNINFQIDSLSIDNIYIYNCILDEKDTYNLTAFFVNFTFDQSFVDFYHFFKYENLYFIMDKIDDKAILLSQNSITIVSSKNITFFKKQQLTETKTDKSFENFSIFLKTERNVTSSNKILEIISIDDSYPNFNLYVFQKSTIIFNRWNSIQKQFQIYHFKNEILVNYSTPINNVQFIGEAHILFSIFYLEKAEINLFLDQNEENENKCFLESDKTMISNFDDLEKKMSTLENKEVIINFCSNTNDNQFPTLSYKSLENKITKFQNKNESIQQKIKIRPENNNGNRNSLSDKHKSEIDNNEGSTIIGKVELTGINFFIELPENSSSINLGDFSFVNNSKFEGLPESKINITFRKLQCSSSDLILLCETSNVTISEELYLKIEDFESLNSNVYREVIFENNANLFIDLKSNNKTFNFFVEKSCLEFGMFKFYFFNSATIYVNNINYTLNIESKIDYKFQPQNNSAYEKQLLEVKQLIYFIQTKYNNNSNNNGISQNQITVKGLFPGNPSNFNKAGDFKSDFVERNDNLQVIFKGLSSTNFLVDSNILPFSFIELYGTFNFRFLKENVYILGDFLYSIEGIKKPKVDVYFYYNDSVINKCKVYFCQKFGGQNIDINMRLYQRNIFVSFKNISFIDINIKEKMCTITFYIFISVNGSSTFEIIKGGERIHPDIYILFDCKLELDDPIIEEFIDNNKEIVICTFINTINSSFYKNWELSPKTHGFYDCFKIKYNKFTKEIFFYQETSPFSIPLYVCYEQYDPCDIILEKDEDFNDIRPLIHKGKYPIIINFMISNDTPLNLNYSYFENSTISIVAYGGMSTFKLIIGKYNVRTVEIMDTTLVVVDDADCKLDELIVGQFSKLNWNNFNGIKRIEYIVPDFIYPNKILNYKGKLVLPFQYDNTVILREKYIVVNYPSFNNKFSMASLFLPNDCFAEIELLLIGGREKTFICEFSGNNDTKIPQISVNLSEESEIVIGSGWSNIKQTNVLKSFANVDNIVSVKTKSFPYFPFHFLGENIDNNNNQKKAVKPLNELMPINLLNENIQLLNNDKIIVDLAETDPAKSSVFINSLDIFGTSHIKFYNSKMPNKNYFEANVIRINPGSDARIFSTRIKKKLVVNEKSKVKGNIFFSQDSCIDLIVNLSIVHQIIHKENILKYNQETLNTAINQNKKNELKTTKCGKERRQQSYFDENNVVFDLFPFIEIERYNFFPEKDSIPPNINLTFDGENHTISYLEISKDEITIKNYLIGKYFPIAKTGLNCIYWSQKLVIKSDVFKFQKLCLNGYLVVLGINGTKPPTPTPTEIEPTFEETSVNPSIGYEEEFNTKIRLSLREIAIISVAAFCGGMIIVVVIVVMFLKKKYKKIYKNPIIVKTPQTENDPKEKSEL